METAAIRSVAEFLGTFFLVLIAAGAVMVDELLDGLTSPLGPALSSGLIVMIMVYAIGNISGAHINPAVTLGFTLTGRISWTVALTYWSAQLGGAVAAAGTLRISLGMVADLGGHTPSGSVIESLVMEVVLTFFLMFTIWMVVRNSHRVGSTSGLIVGGVVALGTFIGEPISGGSMNPARSFGPALAGWVWADHWVYWIGPMLGATLGASTFLCITRLLVKIRETWNH